MYPVCVMCVCLCVCVCLYLFVSIYLTTHLSTCSYDIQCMYVCVCVCVLCVFVSLYLKAPINSSICLSKRYPMYVHVQNFYSQLSKRCGFRRPVSIWLQQSHTGPLYLPVQKISHVCTCTPVYARKPSKVPCQKQKKTTALTITNFNTGL
jgi:hypothetical protein